MFADCYEEEFDPEDLKGKGESIESQAAAEYALSVFNENYRLNKFLKDNGYNNEDLDRINLADEYKSIIQESRGLQEPEDYIPSIVTRLRLDDELEDDVLEGAFVLTKSLTGVVLETDYTPSTYAATSVYLSSMNRKELDQNTAATQQEIAQVMGDIPGVEGKSVHKISNLYRDLIGLSLEREYPWEFPEEVI